MEAILGRVSVTRVSNSSWFKVTNSFFQITLLQLQFFYNKSLSSHNCHHVLRYFLFQYKSANDDGTRPVTGKAGRRCRTYNKYYVQHTTCLAAENFSVETYSIRLDDIITPLLE